MEKLRVACASSLLIVAMVAFLALPGTATADWSGEVETAPTSAYQSVSFDYTVTVTNTGNKTLHVNLITLDIRWPSENWLFPDSSPPHEFFEIYSGNWTIEAGESHTFRSSIKTGFFGSFPTTTTVAAYQEGDGAVSNRTIFGSITFTSAPPVPPNPVNYGLCFGAFFVLFLAVFIIGFYWNKLYWSHEIENALSHQRPDGLLRWKWRPYFWEDEGDMWKNYLLWIVVAIVLSLIWVFAFVR